MSYGAQSMVAPLRRVVVRAPDEAFVSASPEEWHYSAPIDGAAAAREHEMLVAILQRGGAEVVAHDAPLPGLADAIYVHDPVLVTDAGTVVLRMGKARRRGEEAPLAVRLEAAGIPVLGALGGSATAEAGDLLWIDRSTLAVGLSFRTNAEGLDQLRAILAPLGVTCVPFAMPYHDGPAACLHLMSVISLVDEDLAVAFEPLLPVPLWQLLRERDIAIVSVPEAELATQGPNVLALGPRDCLALEGNPRTRAALEDAGCRVQTYAGGEISLKAEGGPTCLTRPIWRQ